MSRRIPNCRPSLRWERRLLRRGFRKVAGLDEAGRGAWAGPLAAAAVILPVPSPALRTALRNVRDSKQLTPCRRTHAAEDVRSVALSWSIGFATAREVDALGPLRATRLAMARAIAALREPPDHLLVDYLHLDESPLPQLSLVRGDALSLSIAAASVLAKTWRDDRMAGLDSRYPGYGFARHKGYGTPEHIRALKRNGVCPEHRISYRPVHASSGKRLRYNPS